jgi:hypothetical protein
MAAEAFVRPKQHDDRQEVPFSWCGLTVASLQWRTSDDGSSSWSIITIDDGEPCLRIYLFFMKVLKNLNKNLFCCNSTKFALLTYFFLKPIDFLELW